MRTFVAGVIRPCKIITKTLAGASPWSDDDSPEFPSAWRLKRKKEDGSLPTLPKARTHERMRLGRIPSPGSLDAPPSPCRDLTRSRNDDRPL
jgi:hypothetical protein